MHTYAKYFLYTCVLFNFCVILFAWKLAVAVWSPWPIVATRKFHFPLQFHHLFPPQHFPALIYSPVDIYHTYQYQLVPKFPIHWCQPVKKRGTFQLNPNLTRTTTSIPEGQMFCRSRWFGLKICLERYISENHPPDSPVLRPGVWIRINRHQRFSVKSRFPALVVRVQPNNPTVRGDERGLPENANWRKETKCFRFGVVLRPPRRTTWWLL